MLIFYVLSPIGYLVNFNRDTSSALWGKNLLCSNKTKYFLLFHAKYFLNLSLLSILTLFLFPSELNSFCSYFSVKIFSLSIRKNVCFLKRILTFFSEISVSLFSFMQNSKTSDVEILNYDRNKSFLLYLLSVLLLLLNFHLNEQNRYENILSLINFSILEQTRKRSSFCSKVNKFFFKFTLLSIKKW